MENYKTIIRATIFKLLFFFIIYVLNIVTVYAEYFPGAHWQEKSPEEVNLDNNTIQIAIQFALDNEHKSSRTLTESIRKQFSREPFHSFLGPVKLRGGPAGLIIKDGYIVAKWGDVEHVDMTFSVSKSYLSTVAGLAKDMRLLDNIHDPVNEYIHSIEFSNPHNAKITWAHLLNQSSDWSGTLFGLHDWADRPPITGTIDDWQNRTLNEPGSLFEYNDVRVNLLAYSLLHVWRKSLPAVLEEKIMWPIGASNTWQWHGYENSYVSIDGQEIQSVSGGGHSGGGMFINTLDQARFGLLFARNGRWNQQQLISENWIHSVQQSSPANSSYGYMWWLNRGPRKWQEVNDESIYYAAGFGGNFIVIDQGNDLVIVTRWLEFSRIGELVAIVLSSLN